MQSCRASGVAGLPTAWDIIWDLKRRYYLDRSMKPNGRDAACG
jgi:hypothetical protein